MIKFLLSTVLCFAVIAAECGSGGPLSRLDSQLDFAPLFFQGLVLSKVISQEDANLYVRGVDRFEVIADDTKSCLSEDVKTDLACYNDLRSESTKAINEFFPRTTGGTVGQWVTLIGQIVDLIVAKNIPVVGVGGPEVDFDSQIDSKIDELERLMKANAAK